MPYGLPFKTFFVKARTAALGTNSAAAHRGRLDKVRVAFCAIESMRDAKRGFVKKNSKERQ